MSTISIIRGDSKSLLVRVLKANGTAVDLSDYTFRFTMKRRTQDEAVVHQAIGSLVDGGVQFDLAPSFTQTLSPVSYPYDIEMANADRTIVHTLVLGVVAVTADIGGPA